MKNPKSQENSKPKANSEEECTLGRINCDQEPIHIPGSIQPHGYLISFNAKGVICRLSDNTENLSGVQAAKLLGSNLNSLIGEENAAFVLEQLEGLESRKHFQLSITQNRGAEFEADARLQQIEGEYVLELEPVMDNSDRFRLRNLDYLAESMREFQESSSPEAMAVLAVKKVKELSGFDRAMVYRFKEDGSGEVIAEYKEAHMDAYLGLNYPASDIPSQARALYLVNPVRLIPDADYQAVRLISAGGQETAEPLDMSQVALRSVSPVHLEYLRNMGVGASMSVSIIHNNKLWGLIACHHSSAHFIGYERRKLCELLGRSFSMLIGEKESLVLATYKGQIEQIKKDLFAQMRNAKNFVEGLYKYKPTVKELIRCGGCVLNLGNQYVSMGHVPSEEQVQALNQWLQKNVEEDLFYTNQLPELFPQAAAWSDKGCGILAIAISKPQQEYIIWFRPEQLQEISWAGREVKETSDGRTELRNSPRKSFQAWTEEVRNRAKPWLGIEVEAATALRSLVVDMVLLISGELKLRADILSRINEEIVADRDELESFAYIAAHDLKEPLRGIHQYTNLVLDEYGQKLEEAGLSKLQAILRLSKRMQQLIDSLFQYSRLGRQQLEKKKVQLKELMEGVLDLFSHQMSPHIHLHMPEKWPVIMCDELLVSEVFMNLISNALKYNRAEPKKVSIGYRKATLEEVSPSGYIFYVKDNGIGIEKRNLDNVFNLFRRLHDREAFGGGVGAGLTISKKIVERHGGRLWVESQPGKGSSFYFSL